MRRKQKQQDQVCRRIAESGLKTCDIRLPTNDSDEWETDLMRSAKQRKTAP